MQHYTIRISFRNQYHSAHILDFREYILANFSSSDIVSDFSGTLKFADNKYEAGYIRNKEAKDLADLASAVSKQLH